MEGVVWLDQLAWPDALAIIGVLYHDWRWQQAIIELAGAITGSVVGEQTDDSGHSDTQPAPRSTRAQVQHFAQLVGGEVVIDGT